MRLGSLPSTARLAMVCALGLIGADLRTQAGTPTAAAPRFDLNADEPGQIAFFGSPDAELFGKEVHDSFEGVLERNYVSIPDGHYPLGFVHASPPPQIWSGTMWTRDAGAFLRELVYWGDYRHAEQTAQCLIDFSGVDPDGYVAFPDHFSPGEEHKTGTELDGQAGIIIAMAALWERLPESDPFRAKLYDFLHGKASPVRYLHHELESHPLIAGSGEFGAGCAVGNPPPLVYNVVQNELCEFAMTAASWMAREAGDDATADEWQRDAARIYVNVGKYLVGADHAWIWCIDPQTMKPDPAILQSPVNVGFGGLNGVACVQADVLGFDDSWEALHRWQQDPSVTTFDHLYHTPLRQQQFDKYGLWTQFDVYNKGLSGGPSYGQGFAIQAMLLFNRLEMADRAIAYLAEATFHPPAAAVFPNGRLSPYYFYERLNSPDEDPDITRDTGCGPLNLVNVADLKSCRECHRRGAAIERTTGRS
jgi:hypothetical protein